MASRHWALDPLFPGPAMESWRIEELDLVEMGTYMPASSRLNCRGEHHQPRSQVPSPGTHTHLVDPHPGPRLAPR